MLPQEALRIMKLVEEERYEEVLGIHFGATQMDINAAHIRLLGKFRDYSEVREVLNKAMNILADESISEKCIRFSAIGRSEKSLPYLRKVVELRGEGQDYFWVGYVLVQRGRYEKALPYFEKAVELRGEGLDYHWCGYVLAELERYEEALPYFEKSLELDGGETDYRWVGETLFQLGRYKEALPYFEKVVELGGSDIDKQWIMACQNKI